MQMKKNSFRMCRGERQSAHDEQHEGCQDSPRAPPDYDFQGEPIPSWSDSPSGDRQDPLDEKEQRYPRPGDRGNRDKLHLLGEVGFGA